MTETLLPPKREKDPHLQLAILCHVRLGVVVAPEALRAFVRDHWSKLSLLAHAIHSERPDPIEAADRQAAAAAAGYYHIQPPADEQGGCP